MGVPPAGGRVISLPRSWGKNSRGFWPTHRRSTGRAFQTAQMWGQIVMKDLLGTPIAPDKLNQVTASAVAACDAADGVTDGVIDDPRTCHFSAMANLCSAPTAPATNCLS